MNRKSVELKYAPESSESPKEAFLATIGHRFHEIRGAKRFARTGLAKGADPRAILARALELCQRFYSGLPDNDRMLMTDVVMSAVSSVIADWRATPDPVLTRINDWIDKTIATNRNFIRVNAARGKS